jgi:hypothetical protein
LSAHKRSSADGRPRGLTGSFSRSGTSVAINQSSSRSVVILGMHRSGTSVITRVVNLLGLPLCDRDEFVTGPGNPTGHWESASLVEFNERLLRALGGRFDAPPDVVDGWEKGQRVASLYSEAAAVFSRAYATKTWVWKDPRTCLTLPFWRLVWSDAPVAVFVYREPLEVFLSLGKRDGIGKAHCIALWERYTRSALQSAIGLPLVTVRFDELLADPDRTVAQLHRQLIALGVSAPGDGHAAAQFVSCEQGASRHMNLHLVEDRDVTGAQRSLLAIIDSLPRMSSSFAVTDLGEESSYTTELLSAIRFYDPSLLGALGKVWPAFHGAVLNRLPKKSHKRREVESG